MTKKPAVFTAKVDERGRITIPDTMREMWNIKPSDCVEIQIISVVRDLKEISA